MAEKSIEEIEKELIDNFSLFDNWDEKYEYLIELGQALPPMDPALKTDERLVYGCQSSVWFDIHCLDGKINFSVDSDSLIVRGLVSILYQLLNDQPAELVLTADMHIYEDLGLWHHISSQRSNGLNAVMAHLKQAAADCIAK